MKGQQYYEAHNGIHIDPTIVNQSIKENFFSMY